MTRFLLFITGIILIFGSCFSCSENVDGLFDSSDICYSDGNLSHSSSFSNVLKIGFSELSGNYNPLFFQNTADENIVKLFSVSLFDFENDAISEDSISNYKITSSDDGSVVFCFKIRENVLFSDGEILNTDDIIFSMYVLSDPSYDGGLGFKSLPIIGLDEYMEYKTDSISGIIKIDDYSFEIWMEHYDTDFNSLMSFPILPLHHYGDPDLYNYDQNQFGFNKGDLQLIKTKTSDCLGAGPYEVDECKENVIFMSRCETYYKGEPKIPSIEIYDITDIDASGKIDLVSKGELDIIDTVCNIDIDNILSAIELENGIGTFITNNYGFGYIGICADNVKVGNKKDSIYSRYIRKAFATLFSAYRGRAIAGYYGKSASLINYPISSSSRFSPNESDLGYKVPYSLDINGNDICQSEMNEEDFASAALDAFKGYFIAAGFVFDDESGKFVSAPDGASLCYNVTVNAKGVGDHPCYYIFENAKNALSNFGINLLINDVEDIEDLWLELESGNCQIWAAGLNTKIEFPLYQMFHSSFLGATNYYGVDDEKLDELLCLERTYATDQRKQIQMQCFDIIFDWGVIVPVYQRKNALIINSYLFDTSLMEDELTDVNVWIDNIHLLQKID